ncbi:hypothetical protein B0H17DRAFT_1062366 [Mycena rosella]|uniref:Uncharacterized protein n=1 Tax=Mycena rosella TaxID=1033263 RepID=A0AAD7DHN5_MYCRO|nr:hypothetical protein B0H17DRAFT_1062366 [Mycena rosella]
MWTRSYFTPRRAPFPAYIPGSALISGRAARSRRDAKIWTRSYFLPRRAPFPACIPGRATQNLGAQLVLAATPPNMLRTHSWPSMLMRRYFSPRHAPSFLAARPQTSTRGYSSPRTGSHSLHAFLTASARFRHAAIYSSTPSPQQFLAAPAKISPRGYSCPPMHTHSPHAFLAARPKNPGAQLFLPADSRFPAHISGRATTKR